MNKNFIGHKNIFNQKNLFKDEDVFKEEVFSNDEEVLLNEMYSVIRSTTFDKYFEEELINCVQMHQFLREFLKKAQDFLSPCLFPIVFLTTSYLIFVSYNFINVSL